MTAIAIVFRVLLEPEAYFRLDILRPNDVSLTRAVSRLVMLAESE